MTKFAFNRRHVYDQIVWVEAGSPKQAERLVREGMIEDVNCGDLVTVSIAVRREPYLDEDAQ